ncbi:bifunctional lysylphosphatidylglycerol synthetase/lysine--tRNA ligase LysX [Corynebacterium falsenii]|uniref:bifunctional lysylphosphatidylglycerol synthetase/lysine--tRNA ligase LysX n=1 Tax=Corynebacterium falsenii TaxID=108486 RepID=UPI001DFC2ED8|nr:bifunctional lysylphosphatidylglycerol synthetase/lysine--tRNA ligase LysX [Corynebacterium falsenii]HJF11924.1 bifunctional lysylphosphatidylglycerol synthetase/lysine--tRNA ligase LysX [Corynebacterium falsenii]
MPLTSRTWRAKVPDIVSWISVLAAIFSVIEYFERYSRNHVLSVIRPVVDVFNIVHGPSIFLALLLLVFASAAYRRKRVVVWLICLVQVFMLVVIGVELGARDDVGQPAGDWYLYLNAAISIVILVALLLLRNEFTSHINAGAAVKGALALVVGQALVLVLGYWLVNIWPGRLAEGSVRLEWVAASAFGYNLFTEESILPHGGHLWLAWVISVLSLVALLVSLRIFLRSQKPGLRSAQDDLDLHRCLADYPGDSLSYFATGNVRQVCFSRDRKAAVSYAVVGDVALAGGDPIGDPASWEDAVSEWLKYVYRAGHVPGVISCSNTGARVFRAAGFRIRAMGDEAIVVVDDFNSNLPTTKPLQEARRRVQRAGVDIECRKLLVLSDEERAEVADAAERFRRGDERGFSMALDRFLEPLDGDQTVVTARDTEGNLEAVLTFVPWGRQGLSLNLMRRSRTSTNGVIEAMVLNLIDYCREHRVEKISLNFAMFRHVFEEGEAVDAGFTQRALRNFMVFASKFWQLQSLYESNARYLPEWQTRYFGYPGTWQMTSIIIASGRAEGFLPGLGWEPPGTPSWVRDEEHIRAVRKIYEDAVQIDYEPAKLNEQQRVRRAKATRLEAAGMDPYPPGQPQERPVAVSLVDSHDGEEIWVHARIQAKRNHGGLTFVDLYDGLSGTQALFESHAASDYALVRLLDVGDTIAVHGRVGTSNTGERTVFVDQWRMLAKSLRPVPPPSVAIDRQTLARDRTLQFINQPRSMTLLHYRSRAGAALRRFLTDEGYSEVETPILNPVSGGANARPFFTHLNAYNATVSLRIAPELYLKRLAIGGMKAVFELGKSFRNEGVDATHNPEFISLEAYKAGSDYTDMRTMTENLIRASIQAIHGKQVIWQPKDVIEDLHARRLPTAPELHLSEGPGVADPTASEEERAYSDVFHNSPVELVEVDVSEPWPVVTVLEGISVATGQHVDSDTSVEQLCALAEKHGVDVGIEPSWAHAVNELYEALVEPTTSYPTFYTDFPAEISPLTRGHRSDEKLAEKWDLVAFGMELGTAYTELTDPREQAKRFYEQSLAAAAGDPEAMSLDQDFLDAMELGLVPTGGMGMGFDRMVMLICGTDIRQVITFPYVRPLER